MNNSTTQIHSPETDQLAKLRKEAKPLVIDSLRWGDKIKASEEQLSAQEEAERRGSGPKEYYSLYRRIASQTERKHLVDKKVRRLLEPYAKASCQSFCETVLHSLPREIRDMVYEHLHAHDTIYVGPEYAHRSDQPCESDCGAHYWDTEYVGDAMKHELVESWYRTTLFYFYDKANNTQAVNRFLSMDRWGLGLKPRDFICRVRFDLGAGDNKLHNAPHCCNVIGLAETLTQPIKNLHQLPNHVHFFIRIHTYLGLAFGCLRGAELRRTVEVLVSDLKALNAAGHRFIVQWPELQNLEFRSKTCGYEPDAWMMQIEDVRRLQINEICELR